jgi:hypothetical protein
VDCVAATLMGFDWRKIRLLKNSFQIRELNFTPFGPEGIGVVSDNPAWSGKMDSMAPAFHFRPHFGWSGAIEREQL